VLICMQCAVAAAGEMYATHLKAHSNSMTLLS
jgi:hypothetical protein